MQLVFAVDEAVLPVFDGAGVAFFGSGDERGFEVEEPEGTGETLDVNDGRVDGVGVTEVEALAEGVAEEDSDIDGVGESDMDGFGEGVTEAVEDVEGEGVAGNDGFGEEVTEAVEDVEGEGETLGMSLVFGEIGVGVAELDGFTDDDGVGLTVLVGEI